MKIGIIGDTHFGAGYNMGKLDPKTQLNTRLLDFSNTFNTVIDEFIKRGVKNENQNFSFRDLLFSDSAANC